MSPGRTPTRSDERAAQLRASGAEAVAGDAFDATHLRALVAAAAPDVVVHQLTDLPPSFAHPLRAARSFRRTNELRRRVTRNLVEAAGSVRVVAQGVAFAYGPGPGIRTEDDPLDVEGRGAVGASARALREMEEVVLAGGGTVLRYGSFYGPGTYYSTDGAMTSLIRRRLLPLVGGGHGYFTFVHVDDAAAATVAALHGPAGIYNVVDDEPVRVREWVPFVADLLGARPPLATPRMALAIGPARLLAAQIAGHPPVSNASARDVLGWRASRRWHEGLRNDLT